MSLENRYSSSWRDRKGGSLESGGKGLRKRPYLTLFYIGCVALLAGALYFFGAWIYGRPGSIEGEEAPAVHRGNIPESGASIDLKDLGLKAVPPSKRYVLQKEGVRLTVISSIDSALQKYISQLVDHSRTVQAAVVVLRPDDGRVLALVNYQKDGKAGNLCTRALYPAASLFKIVSAAAAMDKAGYTPERTVYYTGRRHTLYKKQLQRKKSRYARKTTFRRAFASSINSVFGKLGIYDLGGEVLTEYAHSFFFNRTIPFELPVVRSRFHVPDDKFGLAEVSSGFNQHTRISPLHAALLACVPANLGILMVPRLIDRVEGPSGEVLYQAKPAMLTATVSRGTADGLRALMEDTVLYGTCSKAFGPLRRKRAFREVELGAKTGNVNDPEDRFKYDWVTAYALPRNGKKGICLSVLAVHGEKLGLRANEIGRYVINYALRS